MTIATIATIARLPEAIEFFIAHGYRSWNPAIETQEEGIARSAREQAGAELAALNLGWEVRWEDDWDGDHSYTEQAELDGYEVSTCEQATLYDQDGDHLESLGCVDDADNNYRRVIEAQLIDQALRQLASEAQARDDKPTNRERRVVLAAAPPRRR
jgi:hypothetical protein